MVQETLETEIIGDRPTVTFKSITFSDGKNLALEENGIVVFVGPNNAGKSVALKELQEHLTGASDPKVVKSVELRKTGTPEGFLKFLNLHTEISARGSGYRVQGAGIGLNTNKLETLWTENTGQLHPLFCVGIDTETRIRDSNPVEAIDPNTAQPQHPIHRLYIDDKIELRISKYFEQAFGQALILDQRAGSQIPLRVGKRLTPKPDESLLSATFWKRQREASVQTLEDNAAGQDAIWDLERASGERLILEARLAAISVHDGDDHLQDLDEAMLEARLGPDQRKRILIRAWETAVEGALEDGLVSLDEENALAKYADHFALTQKELDGNRAQTSLVQAAVIRDVAQGIVPQRQNINGAIPFNLMKSEKLVLSQLGFGICLRKGPIELSCLVGSVDGGGGNDGQGQIRGAAGTGTTGRAPATDPGWQKLSPSDR